MAETSDTIAHAKSKKTALAWGLRAGAQLVLAAVFIGGGIAGMQWLIATKPTLGSQAATEPVYAVEASRTRLETIQPNFEVFGALEARSSVELRALVAGEVVFVNDALVVGDRVSAGAELIRIDPFSYQGAVTEAEANLAENRAQLNEATARLANEQVSLTRAQEQLEIAQRELERAQALARRGTGTEATVDARRLTVSQRQQSQESGANAIVTRSAEIERLEASQQRLQWRLDQAQRDLRDTSLRAPFDAIIRTENVEVGRRLGVNDFVAELYESNSLDVRFTVSDRLFGRLREEGALLGRRVQVSWAIGDTPVSATAVVDRIGSDVSATRGGVELIARINDEDALARLKPGAVVTVTAPDRAYENAVQAAETALFNGDHVFLIVPDEEGATRLRRQAATALAWDGSDVILRADPPEALEGALMLTTRLAEAGDGVRVRVIDENRAADAAATN